MPRGGFGNLIALPFLQASFQQRNDHAKLNVDAQFEAEFRSFR
jgi:hypothetical protein